MCVAAGARLLLLILPPMSLFLSPPFRVLRNSREHVALNTESLPDWPAAVEADARARVALLEWAANDPPPAGVLTTAAREQQLLAMNRLAVRQGWVELRGMGWHCDAWVGVCATDSVGQPDDRAVASRSGVSSQTGNAGPETATGT